MNFKNIQIIRSCFITSIIEVMNKLEIFCSFVLVIYLSLVYFLFDVLSSNEEVIGVGSFIFLFLCSCLGGGIIAFNYDTPLNKRKYKIRKEGLVQERLFKALYKRGICILILTLQILVALISWGYAPPLFYYLTWKWKLIYSKKWRIFCTLLSPIVIVVCFILWAIINHHFMLDSHSKAQLMFERCYKTFMEGGYMHLIVWLLIYLILSVWLYKKCKKQII